MLAILVIAQVMSVASANLIAVALPPLSADLHASPTQEQWIVDAYVLVFAALLVAGGVLSDRYGRRRALIAGFALFALGALGSALAPNPSVLIAARVVQALGPPLILPASLAILTANVTDPVQRARAIGFWGAASGFGVAIGPVLGGALVSGLGWRWAFGVNVVVAAGLALATVRVIPEHRPARPAHRFDHVGALLVTFALGALVFGLIEGPARGWTSAEVLGSFALAALTLAAFLAAERRHPAPLIDLDLLRAPAFAAANLAAATVMFVLLATTVYLSAFLQTFRELTPLQTGLALLPLGGAVALLAPVSGRLTAHIRPRTLIALGLLCAAAGSVVLSRIGGDDGPAQLWLALLLIGAGAGVAFPPTTATAVSSVPGERTGMASAIHNAGRQVGATLGVAALGSIVIAHATQGGAAAYADGLSIALLVGAGALLAATGLTLKLL
ncbi:MFS transporter [Solirubrobacter sp. CPCC 204708]|uniref:MFS transporter n=1 Tax=Solirubrobacter deserti TaxID=2282478 RepID=A0ABT4RUU5_9ACTN|nr:MFS transporter [Solirubrobacter deserti]MBE2319332.1 MFS transporter [Solirubrobacter deserti]MDA0142306.1 MFS transporter [Solirubrobacter deserti]